MKLSQFSFTLPNESIAKTPAKVRDAAKLMVVNRSTKKISHLKFAEILDLFEEDDVFILNNTKVFPARMYGNKEKTGAKIEVFLLRELNKELRLWDVLVDPARKIRVGNKLYFGDDDLVAEVVDNTTSRGRTLRFLFEGSDEEFNKVIKKLGETPIPKYLDRKVEMEDESRYQTIFASSEGAVSPPTAGMHFTRELLLKLDIKGIKLEEITLHQGLGAFRDIEVEDLTKHKMDSEYYIINEKVAASINNAKQKKRKILAVGSGAMRAVESSVSAMSTLNASEGWTDKFIFPPYDFSIANCFLTNFHQPESSLFMLTSAFCDYDLIMTAYEEALRKKYKFLCYGDALLIL